MLELANLSKKYGTEWALQGISCTLDRSEGIIGLLGRNGAGKTTLLKILSGLLYPGGGSIQMFGLKLPGDGLEVRKKVGYMPESGSLYKDMSLRSYLYLMGRLRKIPGDQLQQEVEECMDRCDLRKHSGRLIQALSRGMTQRVHLAESLLGKPDLLLLDEPTQGMDPSQIRDVRKLIQEQARDSLVILSTHIISQVERFCDRALVLRRGRLIANVTKEEWQNDDSEGLETYFE